MRNYELDVGDRRIRCSSGKGSATAVVMKRIWCAAVDHEHVQVSTGVHLACAGPVLTVPEIDLLWQIGIRFIFGPERIFPTEVWDYCVKTDMTACVLPNALWDASRKEDKNTETSKEALPSREQSARC